MPLDQRSHGVGRDRTLLQPEVDALFVDLDDGRLGARIVMSEDFDERAVARRTRIGDHDAEERTLFGSCAAQTNGDHVTLLDDARGSYPNVCFAARARLEAVALRGPLVIGGCAASALPGGAPSCRRRRARPSRRAASTSSSSARTA